MPELLKEKVNIPITFELDSPDKDEDDGWPTPERSPRLPERGVMLLSDHRSRQRLDDKVWDQQTIHESISACREMGFTPGAIVAPRPLLGSGSDWKVKLPVYWGVITSLNTYIPGQQYQVYAPITVKWLVPSNHANYVEAKLFPFDLYLLHKALSDDEIAAKMKDQQQ